MRSQWVSLATTIQIIWRDKIHDSLKGFLVSLLAAGITLVYVVAHKTTSSALFYLPPLVCFSTIVCMPNLKWLMGAAVVYVPPFLLLCYGLSSSEDMDAAGGILLAALVILAVSLGVGLIVRFFLVMIVPRFRNSIGKKYRIY